MYDNEYTCDYSQVTRMIFSHQHISKKNALVISLIEHVSSREPALIQELKEVLTELTQLGKVEHSRVSLQVVFITRPFAFESVAYRRVKC